MTLLPTVSSRLLSAMLMALERNSSSETDPGPPAGPLIGLTSASPEWFCEPQAVPPPAGPLQGARSQGGWKHAVVSPAARGRSFLQAHLMGLGLSWASPGKLARLCPEKQLAECLRSS